MMFFLFDFILNINGDPFIDFNLGNVKIIDLSFVVFDIPIKLLLFSFAFFNIISPFWAEVIIFNVPSTNIMQLFNEFDNSLIKIFSNVFLIRF